MNSDLFWSAFALMLILEGLLPVFAPGQWRKIAARLVELRDGQLRFFGLCTIVVGLLLYWLVG
ncbi:MAG: DUF2065 domain-containing protein [Burkholderiaceae bacterium]|nr:DUF2065 domain-containing protein [Burkholderiaceae bacterium]